MAAAYDFARNTITDANDWFNNLNGIPLPPVHRHNFGGTVGGPIFKNKTFFFFDYDGTRQSSMATYQAGVPSDAERNDGDFGEVCTAHGGTFDYTGMCTVARGRFGILIPARIKRQLRWFRRRGAVSQRFHPLQQHRRLCQSGQSQTGRYALSVVGGPGNLIDPVAQKMMQIFPEPTPNMASPTIYDNWSPRGRAAIPTTNSTSRSTTASARRTC